MIWVCLTFSKNHLQLVVLGHDGPSADISFASLYGSCKLWILGGSEGQLISVQVGALLETLVHLTT